MEDSVTNINCGNVDSEQPGVVRPLYYQHLVLPQQSCDQSEVTSVCGPDFQIC